MIIDSNARAVLCHCQYPLHLRRHELTHQRGTPVSNVHSQGVAGIPLSQDSQPKHFPDSIRLSPRQHLAR